MLKTLITDPKKKTVAYVDATEGEDYGLVVATRPLKSFTNALRFFSNDEYGIDMNQDASASGTAEEVHNGIDDILWTGSNIMGTKVKFDSGDQNHTLGGGKSIKSVNIPVGDVFQFNKGSDLDCSAYVGISLWVWVDKDWKAGDSVGLYGWDTGTGLQVGDVVLLENYFNYSVVDTWQKLVIPLTDMGDLASYTTLDALRVRQISAEGKAPKYYIDDIQFEETGAPVEFSVEPDNGTWLHVNSFQVVTADAYTGKIDDTATMPSIPYNKFFGVTSLAGINYKRTIDGETLNSYTIMRLLDIMMFSQAKMTGYGSDGTNSWMSMLITFTDPVILKSEDKDAMSFTISDDWSGLLELRVSAGCKIEQRP